MSILYGIACMYIIYCYRMLCDNITEGEAGGWYNKEKSERSYEYGYDEDR